MDFLQLILIIAGFALVIYGFRKNFKRGNTVSLGYKIAAILIAITVVFVAIMLKLA